MHPGPAWRRRASSLAGALALGLAAASAVADPAQTAAGAAVTTRPETVLSRTPREADWVQEDVRPYLERILAQHGEEEWKATLLTHEFHHHLGAWSILGAKMGVRARELLGASVDAVQVESHAGLTPPLSCLNDGLQVGSGATIGRGSFVIRAETAAPEAVFRSETGAVRLRVRPEVTAAIRDEIARLVTTHGEGTPAYFAAVRAAALRWWADFDRREVFVEERLAAVR